MALGDAGLQAIMQAHDADRLAVLDDEQRGDGFLVHYMQRFRRQRSWADGARLRGHHVGGAAMQQIAAHVAPQIAVGDDTGQIAPCIDDADAAIGLGGDLQDRLLHAGLKADQRQLLADMHQIGNAQQFLSQLAARMQLMEILRRESLALQQRHGQRITQSQHHGGGGGGRDADQPGLAHIRQQQGHVGGAAQRAVAAAGDADQRNRPAPGVADDVGQFEGLARVGQGDHRIGGRHHAEIAVAGFRRMDELRRGSGRGKGGGNLAGDVAAFAHAGDDDPAGHPRQQVQRLAHLAVELAGQAQQGFGFLAQDALGRGQPIGRRSTALIFHSPAFNPCRQCPLRSRGFRTITPATRQIQPTPQFW
eukprot:Opistho-1_new@11301